jgi:hypothetical protein
LPLQVTPARSLYCLYRYWYSIRTGHFIILTHTLTLDTQ